MRKQKRKRPAAPKDPKPWEQDEVHDGLDLPDDEFDYDDFVAREFGHVPHRKLGVKWYWWALGCAMLVIVALMIVTRLW